MNRLSSPFRFAVTRLLRCVACVAILQACIANEAVAKSKSGILVGATGKNTYLGRHYGWAVGFSVESEIAPSTIGAVALDGLSISTGGEQNRILGLSYVMKIDVGSLTSDFRWRPGVGLGLGLGQQNGESSVTGCFRFSVDCVWLNPTKQTQWLANIGVIGWGGDYHTVSPLVFVRIGFLR